MTGSGWCRKGTTPSRSERMMFRLPQTGSAVLRVLGGVDPGPPAEHQEVAEGVPTQSVGAVHPAGDLPGRVEPGYDGGRSVRIDLDAAHDVVAGRADLHRLLGDVDVRQF